VESERGPVPKFGREPILTKWDELSNRGKFGIVTVFLVAATTIGLQAAGIYTSLLASLAGSGSFFLALLLAVILLASKPKPTAGSATTGPGSTG
jgi:hypothetical protein